MNKNPILDQLHATRERLLAESGGTVAGLLERLRTDQAGSDHPAYQPTENRRKPQRDEIAEDDARRASGKI